MVENEKPRPRRTPFLLFTVFLLCGILALPGFALAENHTDPAPYIEPTSANGYRVLFDNTHGQTAGAADWVIDGAFSDFANALANEGYYVEELRKGGSITYADLSGFDVFIIPEANIPFKTSEQAAILQFAQNGGGVFFIADHYNADRNKNRWDSSEVFNGYRRGAYSNPTQGMSAAEAACDDMNGVVGSDWLATNFGVRFRYNAIGDVTANNIVAPAQCFGITQGVDTVAVHAGSTLAIINPDIAKGIVYLPSGLTSSNKWSNAVDDGVYNGGGVAEGPYVAISKVSAGKAAFLGDSSAVEDATPKYLREENGSTKTTYAGFSEQDDAILLVQLVDWLAEQESYTSFTTQNITLDSATTLFGFETPASSTEPQSEPWAAPAAGYLWHDESTFAYGSYGYTGSEQSDFTYLVGMPQQINTGMELPVTIYFANLTPNTTYSGYKLGAYLSDGTQIGKFADVGGTLPDAFGYSGEFTITTDANGCASKTMIFLLNSSATGTFNIRLKQGSANVYTATHTIASTPGGSGTVYSAAYPDCVVPGMDTAVTIRITGLSANQTVSGLKAGSYLSSGTQIAQFCVDGGTWSAAFGYSDTFAMTADSSGVAVKTILMRLNSSLAAGSANFRIKNGSTNVLTQSLTIH